jgi:hypothetical protein
LIAGLHRSISAKAGFHARLLVYFYVIRLFLSGIFKKKENSQNEKGYLKEVNQEATAMLESLIRQYAKAEGVTEALKRTNQLGWVQRMNSIRNRAEEVVLNEIIYR